MVDMRGYAIKVHRSLLQRDLMAGIPTIGLMLLMILSVVFLYVLRIWFMIAPIVVLYLIMRHLTAKDPWLMEIVIDNITQKDIYIP